jgi:hypothetical protein
VNGDLEVLDLWAPDVAMAIREQSRQLEGALLSTTRALDRAVDRVAGALPGAEPAVSGPPALAAPAVPSVAPGFNPARVVTATSVPVLVTAVGAAASEPVGTSTGAAVPAIAPPAVGIPVGGEPTIASPVSIPAEEPVPAVGDILRDVVASLARAAEPLVELVEALSPPAAGTTIAEQVASATGAPTATVVTPIPAPSASLTPGAAIEPTSGQAIVSRAAGAALSPLAGLATPAAEIPAVGASVPALRAPALPTAGPLVEQILSVPQPSREVPAAGEVTITGGVNVQVSAETIDLENAEETARVMASHVLEELNRLVERDRFRRGLPTAPTA